MAIPLLRIKIALSLPENEKKYILKNLRRNIK
jgi:hypothetical protein